METNAAAVVPLNNNNAAANLLNNNAVANLHNLQLAVTHPYKTTASVPALLKLKTTITTVVVVALLAKDEDELSYWRN